MCIGVGFVVSKMVLAIVYIVKNYKLSTYQDEIEPLNYLEAYWSRNED
jgi:hypothetical protein